MEWKNGGLTPFAIWHLSFGLGFSSVFLAVLSLIRAANAFVQLPPAVYRLTREEATETLALIALAPARTCTAGNTHKVAVIMLSRLRSPCMVSALSFTTGLRCPLGRVFPQRTP